MGPMHWLVECTVAAQSQNRTGAGHWCDMGTVPPATLPAGGAVPRNVGEVERR